MFQQSILNLKYEQCWRKSRYLYAWQLKEGSTFQTERRSLTNSKIKERKWSVWENPCSALLERKVKLWKSFINKHLYFIYLTHVLLHIFNGGLHICTDDACWNLNYLVFCFVFWKENSSTQKNDFLSNTKVRDKDE